MGGALLGARHFHAGEAACRPPAHHCVGDLRVELDAVGARPVAERLHREGVTLGEQLGALRQVQAFAVPLIDVVGPAGAHAKARRGRADRVITALDLALGMQVDPGAEVARQHLGAEADAEEGLLLGKRHADPIDLAPDEGFVVVRALRAAEDDRAGVVGEGVGKRLVEARAADVERIAAGFQRVPDAARRRMLLMQNDQDGREHTCGGDLRLSALS